MVLTTRVTMAKSVVVMMGAVAEGTLGEKNWGGRIVHLNMKLITCKYNANDMQTSTGFL